MAPQLGYWNLRGYGQMIRLLLAYTDTEFEDKKYNLKHVKDNEYDASEWTEEKFSLGLPFPNLPYYIDGDVKLSQTCAILKYLGGRHGLLPVDQQEKMRVDLIEGEALDLRSKWFNLCYLTCDAEDFEKRKPDYLAAYSLKLKEFSDFLGTRSWFAGESMTYVDFMMYELFDVHLVLEPKAFEKFTNLRAYVERFRQLKNISAYMKSDAFMDHPLNGPMAHFGGQ